MRLTLEWDHDWTERQTQTFIFKIREFIFNVCGIKRGKPVLIIDRACSIQY
jgi:hypothetical protein